MKLFNKSMLPDSLRLRLAERAIKREYLTKIREAKKEGDEDELVSVEHVLNTDLFEVEEERREILQKRLIRKANRLLIQVPTPEWGNDDDENWRRSPISGTLLLRDAPRSDLAREIRKVRKEQLDLWVPIISQLIALCGLGVAALSIWFKG